MQNFTVATSLQTAATWNLDPPSPTTYLLVPYWWQLNGWVTQ